MEVAEHARVELLRPGKLHRCTRQEPKTVQRNRSTFFLHHVPSQRGSLEALSLLPAIPAALLVGPYANLPPRSFVATAPLTLRQRHADLLLQQLLSLLGPGPPPRWPPLDPKPFRVELSKRVEALLRAEKEHRGWGMEVIWRKSTMDEATGPRWQAAIELLATLVLRQHVEADSRIACTSPLASACIR